MLQTGFEQKIQVTRVCWRRLLWPGKRQSRNLFVCPRFDRDSKLTSQQTHPTKVDYFHSGPFVQQITWYLYSFLVILSLAVRSIFPLWVVPNLMISKDSKYWYHWFKFNLGCSLTIYHGQIGSSLNDSKAAVSPVFHFLEYPPRDQLGIAHSGRCFVTLQRPYPSTVSKQNRAVWLWNTLQFFTLYKCSSSPIIRYFFRPRLLTP